ncbi:MAG: ATP-binding cassette domain-containing protein [Ruminococcus sp.]|nr:ATP-binding cassette domain-containing protein [Ruminococcus sp.]MBQ7010015.1 ATP-binding cassette domain-containing protein [Ruminococcus sp.]
MSYLLETDKLTKIYGKQKAVNEVNVHLEKGAIYGFIGRNGAGKTTFLKMICGMAKPTSGDITLFGKKNNDRASEMKKIGVLIEDPGIFPGMTAYDNLKLKCKAAGINKEGYIEGILKTIGLEKVGKKKAGCFSLGMKQRLGIGLALVGDPELLLLDEPINGLDPQGILEVREMLTSLVKERNMTIIISSHILEELSKVATHFGIIDNGVLIKELSHDELVEECRERIKLITDGSSQAAAEAVKSLGINKMNIIDDNNIEILEGFDSVPEMVFALAEKKIRVKSISVANDSIEEYFIKLTGGKNNA